MWQIRMKNIEYDLRAGPWLARRMSKNMRSTCRLSPLNSSEMFFTRSGQPPGKKTGMFGNFFFLVDLRHLTYFSPS